MLVSHVQQGLVEERKILKFSDCTSGDFRDFPMRKRPVSSEPKIRVSGCAVERESFNPRESERVNFVTLLRKYEICGYMLTAFC